MKINCIVDDTQWEDFGGVERGDVIEIQLQIRYPEVLYYNIDKIYKKNPEKSLKSVSDSSAIYELSGTVLASSFTDTNWELLIDCGIPIRITNFKSESQEEKNSLKKNKPVISLGMLSGDISFNVGELHKPVVGKVLNIKKLGNFNLAYLVTVELVDEAPSKRRISWLPRSDG